MSAEWKPGDVAMVKVDGKERPAVRSEDGSKWVIEPTAASSPRTAESARPLVVIDPEDREQADRLCKVLVEAMYRAGDEASAANGVHPATVTAALREFANPTPPKPEEPTGLGAVVEDADGRRWVLLDGPILPDEVWYCGSLNTRRAWSKIAAVRILSDGVQP